MARHPRRTLLAASLVLAAAACGGPRGVGLPPDFGFWIQEAPEDMPIRLWTDGSLLVGFTAPMDHRSLPADVRRTAEMLIPHGDTIYAAREISPAGDGFRLEKRYVPDDPALPPELRSVLLSAEGRVLERTHQILIPQVPEAALFGGLQYGNDIENAFVVQADGEWFRFDVRSKIGWSYVVDVTPEGEVLSARRRKSAEVHGNLR